MKGLRVALPGGTLFESACDLLNAAGVARLDPTRFDRELSIRDGDNVYVKVRPTDVPVYVEIDVYKRQHPILSYLNPIL